VVWIIPSQSCYFCAAQEHSHLICLHILTVFHISEWLITFDYVICCIENCYEVFNISCSIFFTHNVSGASSGFKWAWKLSAHFVCIADFPWNVKVSTLNGTEEVCLTF
jgi:hypothetical protein